jgi:hypothetical protein
MMARIGEDLLMAHVDSQLDALTDGRVAKALANDSELAAMAQEQRLLRDRLAAHFGPIADEEVPLHLSAMLETNVVSLPAARREDRSGFGWRAWGAMAATFVVGIVAAQMIPQRTGPTGVTGTSLVAAGPLARALDSQLVSEQANSDSTRIGVSFAAKDGRICRTFENDVMTGLACREAGGWQVLVHSAAGTQPGGEYRQATSGTEVVMRISQELMKGEPFDARMERQARDGGWVSRR